VADGKCRRGWHTGLPSQRQQWPRRPCAVAEWERSTPTPAQTVTEARPTLSISHPSAPLSYKSHQAQEKTSHATPGPWGTSRPALGLPARRKCARLHPPLCRSEPSRQAVGPAPFAAVPLRLYYFCRLSGQTPQNSRPPMQNEHVPLPVAATTFQVLRPRWDSDQDRRPSRSALTDCTTSSDPVSNTHLPSAICAPAKICLTCAMCAGDSTQTDTESEGKSRTRQANSIAAYIVSLAQSQR
jgi:hypothetical protein